MTSNEGLKAARATDQTGPTIFDKILTKEIPARVAYEDDLCLAFHDISPQAPVHILVIPKDRQELTRLQHATKEHRDILGHLMWATTHVARLEQLDTGYRVVINDGQDGCQSVYHLHLHLLGGRTLGWPPG